MLFPLGTTTKDAIVRILSVSWPLTPIKIWNAVVKENYTITYKAVYKALQEMAQEKTIEKTPDGYKLNEQWLKTTANTALEILKTYQIKNKITGHELIANFTIYKYSDEFYRIVTNMLLNSTEIRLASKTPAILISKESSKTYLRKHYLELLWKKIKTGTKVYYLLPTELIANLKTKPTYLELTNLLEEYSNLQIRHAPIHSVVKMAITEKEAVIGLAAPPNTDLAAFLKIEGTNLTSLIELYNSIFVNGKSLTE